MPQIDLEEAKSIIGEGFHASIRKAGYSDVAGRISRGIDLLDPEEWDAILSFLVEGLAAGGIHLAKDDDS